MKSGFSEMLSELRREKGISQKKAAKDLEISQALLSHYENSDTRVGFIHIPYSKEQGKTPSMEMRDIIKALTVAIENLE